jgi:hypothetical protein
MGAQFPAKHQFGEESGISPRQRGSADRHLVLDDAAPRLDGSLIAHPLQVVDQGALP